MATFPTKARYSVKEVKLLVEGFEEYRNLRGTEPGLPLLTLCKLVDIERALTRLEQLELRCAVLLCGVAGISDRTAGRLLEVPYRTVSWRYQRGLEMLTTDLNGRTE